MNASTLTTEELEEIAMEEANLECQHAADETRLLADNGIPDEMAAMLYQRVNPVTQKAIRNILGHD